MAVARMFFCSLAGPGMVLICINIGCIPIS